ncbi:MAG: Nif11-like leader peptide family RiPP precursor [Synergistaceae bacterium]|nr:Nif11-like leader peptide family RiPP precursor [Synergistaceae bacterium]
MTFTKEQIRKAMACKTADELLALAKSEGVELTSEQAEEYIAQTGMRELTDKELGQVAGGCFGRIRQCKGYCPDHCGKDDK